MKQTVKLFQHIQQVTSVELKKTNIYIYVYMYMCTYIRIYMYTRTYIFRIVKCLTNNLIKPKYKQHYNSISTVQ